MSSALVGRGQALLALNRDADALAAFEAALAADPSLTDLRAARRGAAVPQRRAGTSRARGRRRGPAASTRRSQAYTHGDCQLARQPVPVPRARRRRTAARATDDAALEHFRKAVDARPERREIAGADWRAPRGARRLRGRGEGLRRLRSPSSRTPALQARLDARARARRRWRGCRRSTARSTQAPQITRARSRGAHRRPARAAAADAAAARDAALITDVRNHWAATWIMTVARAGVMEPFANHAFQPRTLVRRSRSRAGGGAAAAARGRATTRPARKRGSRRG